MDQKNALLESIRMDALADVERIVSDRPELAHEKDERGFTPLILATYYDRSSISEFLIASGADVNAQDASGNTALMGVCFKGAIELAKMLIDRGADVDIQNYNGATALIFSAMYKNSDIAKTLLKAGADKSIADENGRTALDHARSESVPELIEVLS